MRYLYCLKKLLFLLEFPNRNVFKVDEGVIAENMATGDLMSKNVNFEESNKTLNWPLYLFCESSRRDLSQALLQALATLTSDSNIELN